MLLRAFRTFWYQIVLCSDTGTLFFWEKLKNRFSKKSLQWSCSNQKTNIEYFHYIYRWTYHKNITALIQRTVEIYYYPLRPLKWAKTQKLAPTAHFKGYDPTFWAKRHTITSRMIPKVKKIYPKKPPCSSRSIPLKKNKNILVDNGIVYFGLLDDNMNVPCLIILQNKNNYLDICSKH